MANTQRRMLYSKIWTSEQVGKLSDKAKLLFIGTITLADDDGRLRGNPAYLRGQIFPYEENLTVTEVLQFRNEIEKNGLIQVYSSEDCEYIQHPKWLEYQIIRKDLYKESSLPSRNETVTSPLRKRTLSKDKISKDKIRQEAEPSSDLIVQVITSFKDINASYKKWYANKNQRSACQRLIDTHGLEQVLKVVAILPQSNVMPYIPSITTPLQLEDKWAQLEAGLKRKKNELQINQRTVIL